VSAGWSINLTTAAISGVFWADLPCPPLYVGKHGPVVELVFWSERAFVWVHGVSLHFERELPSEHVQVTLGDMAWIDQLVRNHGEDRGLDLAVQELQQIMVPGS